MRREIADEQLKEGSMAPDFDFHDLNDENMKLSDLRGKKRVVIYFYPKDFTPGCTNEAMEFTRDYGKFKDADIEIIGVSPDNEESHKSFRYEIKIPYLLASDIHNEISKKYGVYGLKKFMGKEFMGVSRSTFLIDKNGRVVKIFSKVKPPGHSQEVIEAFN